MKKIKVRYYIQANLEGGFDIVKNTSTDKVVRHTDSEQSAKDIIQFITKGNNKI